MPEITRALLRKRAEHNEGIISTLEEISLHQEELEGINEVLGQTCRKIRILYLQNNIIPKMQNLAHLKDLQYLNLALNNIQRIEGLQSCEFLNKLDLTANFVDVDELEASMDHLADRLQLRDLYMMGNPAQANWPGFTNYVVARLPQLKTLDGTEITKSMQITAIHKLPQLQSELRALADVKRAEKAEKKVQEEATKVADNCDEEIDTDKKEDLTENTPETRVEIYRELAQQKKEKADREKVNQPKERDYVTEQEVAVTEARQKEQELSDSEIRQKNEGGWEFFWDEESRKGCIVLEVLVAKFLDSSLIDVDVHPTYVSVVIKSKMLRLRLPSEVKVSETKCQRSKITGSLLIIMPKINPKETTLIRRESQKSKISSGTNTGRTRVKRDVRPLSLQEEIALAAANAKNEASGSSSSTSSSVLLDRELTKATSSLQQLSTITKKPNSEGPPQHVFDLPSVNVNLVEELD